MQAATHHIFQMFQDNSENNKVSSITLCIMIFFESLVNSISTIKYTKQILTTQKKGVMSCAIIS